MASVLVARVANTAITALTDNGVIDITSYQTQLTNTGAAAVTLNAGQDVGQLKRIQLVAAAANTVLSSTVLHGASTITFSAVGDVAELLWDGARWRIISLSNAAGSAATPVAA